MLAYQGFYKPLTFRSMFAQLRLHNAAGVPENANAPTVRIRSNYIATAVMRDACYLPTCVLVRPCQISQLPPSHHRFQTEDFNHHYSREQIPSFP